MGWVHHISHSSSSQCLNEHKTGRGPDGVLIGVEWDLPYISLFIVLTVSMYFLAFYKTGRGLGVLLIGVEWDSQYISVFIVSIVLMYFLAFL